MFLTSHNEQHSASHLSPSLPFSGHTVMTYALILLTTRSVSTVLLNLKMQIYTTVICSPVNFAKHVMDSQTQEKWYSK